MLPECRPHSLAAASSHHHRPSRSACGRGRVRWLVAKHACVRPRPARACLPSLATAGLRRLLRPPPHERAAQSCCTTLCCRRRFCARAAHTCSHPVAWVTRHPWPCGPPHLVGQHGARARLAAYRDVAGLVQLVEGHAHHADEVPHLRTCAHARAQVCMRPSNWPAMMRTPAHMPPRTPAHTRLRTPLHPPHAAQPAPARARTLPATRPTSADVTLDSGLYFTSVLGPSRPSNTGSACAGECEANEMSSTHRATWGGGCCSWGGAICHMAPPRCVRATVQLPASTHAAQAATGARTCTTGTAMRVPGLWSLRCPVIHAR